MQLIEQLQELLPVLAPFQLARVEKDELTGQVHIYLEVDAEQARPGEEYHLHSYYERKWEHLRLFQYRTFLHCRLPIYRHTRTKAYQKAAVHFARDLSRFTLDYEQEVMRLMQLHHNFTTVAAQLGIYVQRVEAIYHLYTQASYQAHTIIPCEQVSIDETSTKKGHKYITVFTDLAQGQVLHIETGKSAQALHGFFQQHPYPEAVREVSIDMSPAFISGVKKYFPQAKITFDKWHVVKLLNEHLEDISPRAAQVRDYLSLLQATPSDCLKGKSAQEAPAKLAFMADFAQEQAGKNPFSNSINRHWEGISEYFHSRITNAVAEGINSKIQTLKRVARGFRYVDNFKKLILFVCGAIKPTVPSNFI